MRSLILTALLMLSACAATAPSAPPSTTAPRAAASSGRAAALLHRAGGADAPTPQEIVRVLGAADITRQDGGGVALTYRLDNCALLLLFAADTRNAMRLREAHANPRRAGEAAPSLDQCGAEADGRVR